MTLTPAGQAAVDAHNARQAARWNGQAPTVDPAVTRVPVDKIAVGCTIQARTDGDLSRVRMRADGGARRGIVVDISSRVTDDGEIVTCYWILDPNLIGTAQLPHGMLLAEQVDPAGTRALNVGTLRGAVHSIWQYLGDPTNWRKGPAPERHKRLHGDATRLLAILDQKDLHR